MKRKKKPITPYSKIVSAIRRLWLYSREHQLALKLANRTCSKCGRKAIVAKGKECKVEVHHVEGIGNWKEVVEKIRKEILVTPEKLVVLCKECHKEEHKND